MKINESYIRLNELHFYAHHGVDKQETEVGAWFTVDVKLKIQSVSSALQNDDLEGTVNYAGVYEVIREVMKQPSKLIEHAAGRILEALFSRFSQVEAIELCLQKDNPPMGAHCRGASVELHVSRN